MITATATDESCPGCGQIEGVELTSSTSRVVAWKCVYCGMCWAIQTGRPQSRFDDLYTVVYALIDDAKTRHRVVKLYKGSHGSPDPHPVVLDYGEFFAAHRRGVLGYACDRARPAGADGYRVADLHEFDRCADPRVSTREVFELLARTGRRDGETDDEYLTYGRPAGIGSVRTGVVPVALTTSPGRSRRRISSSSG